MKHILFLIAVLITTSVPAQHRPLTVFEQSEGKEACTYDQTISFYQGLANESAYIEVREMGTTDSGLPLHVVVLDLDRDFDFEASRKKQKTHILINNGIHPGEPDGIEASQMLLRNYAKDEKLHPLLANTVIVVIPTYNIGGALNRNSTTRVNQNGPENYGFRGNARNYDLNRDFIKGDTRNTQSFYKIYHWVRPDIFIDTHVSNGADYQYSITNLATQHNKLSREMGQYLQQGFLPILNKKMTDKGTEITPYVNVFNTTPDNKGIVQFLDNPRYSTGYTALFNTLGFMIETHMLKPFDIRVTATYNFLESVLEIAANDGGKIRKWHQEYRIESSQQHPISWKLDRGQFEEIEFKGYEGELKESEVTGHQRLLYDRKRPFTKKIPYFNSYHPDKEIQIPSAYIIPKGWHQVIELLRLNDIAFQRLTRDTTLTVESYRIKSYKTAESPYEGHYPHYETVVEKTTRDVTFTAGDYIFTTNQSGGRYLVETLEPEAPDSFFNWNFFDTILQQKEHFSPYVFEDEAAKLLDQDPKLKEAFEVRKKEDPDFAKNAYQQLDYIYQQSPYYERAHMHYPVYRLLE